MSKERLLSELIDLLESMIADGVQLVHGGKIMDWNDTNIIEILEKIKNEKTE